jgi:hypothetical protein
LLRLAAAWLIGFEEGVVLKFPDIAKHPLSVAASIAVVSASLAFTAATWEYQVRLKSASVQTDSASVGWLREKANLERQIQDLERTAVTLPVVIGDQKSELNVKRLVLTPREVSTLGSNFRSFGRGRFFADVPLSPVWNYNEGDDTYMWLGPTKIPFTFFQRSDRKAISDAYVSTAKITWVTYSELKQTMQAGFEIAVDAFRHAFRPEEHGLGDEMANHMRTFGQVLGPQEFAALIIEGKVGDCRNAVVLALNSSCRIDDIDRKGSAIWVSYSVTINHDSGDAIHFDDRALLLPMDQGAFLVEVRISSKEGRGPDFVWISKWLQGLRFVNQ